jgi:hypothetical protein
VSNDHSTGKKFSTVQLQGRLSLGPYLEFIARVTSPIPDKGQVMVRYYGLYANAHIYRSSEADVRGGEASALQYSWLP